MSIYFIPYLTYELRTKDKKGELISRLKSLTSKQKLFEINNPAIFWGEVFDSSFRIQRRVRKGIHHNWNPIIHGTVMENENGTTIKIKMSLHLVTKIFSIIVILGAFFAILSNPNELWGSIGLIGFLYAITIIFWNSAVSKSRDSLDHLLGYPLKENEQ